MMLIMEQNEVAVTYYDGSVDKMEAHSVYLFPNNSTAVIYGIDTHSNDRDDGLMDKTIVSNFKSLKCGWEVDLEID